MPGAPFFILPDTARRLGLNLNQTTRCYKKGSSVVRVVDVDVVVPFHIGDRQHRYRKPRPQNNLIAAHAAFFIWPDTARRLGINLDQKATIGIVKRDCLLSPSPLL